jgi:hypothetical protein
MSQGFSDNIVDGRDTVAVAGTRERLAGSLGAVTFIDIIAETDNTGTVAVGGSTVVASIGATQRGAQLLPGDSYTFLECDASDIWIDATVSGDGVTYVAGTKG